MRWFTNRLDAKVIIEDYRLHFNETRPHSSLGQLTPLEFKRKLSQSQPAPEPERLPGPSGPGRLPYGEDD
jgi:transposase InsO family protein